MDARRNVKRPASTCAANFGNKSSMKAKIRRTDALLLAPILPIGGVGYWMQMRNAKLREPTRIEVRALQILPPTPSDVTNGGTCFFTSKSPAPLRPQSPDQQRKKPPSCQPSTIFIWSMPKASAFAATLMALFIIPIYPALAEAPIRP